MEIIANFFCLQTKNQAYTLYNNMVVLDNDEWIRVCKEIS